MNFVFYDTEASGSNTRFDQILQFAAILTDESFNELDSINIRCRLLPHVIPSPEALLVTKIDPNDLLSEKLSHYEMACIVHQKLSSWRPATFIGHNTINFDEEILRQTFWQNLLDPYLSNTKGSVRADLLPVLRAAHTANPEVIKVAETGSGQPSFKLDRIATLNGFENHDAHDALGDCRATIHLARLVRDRAPEVWDRMLENADPKRATELLENNRSCLSMTYFGKPHVHRVMRLTGSPSNPKKVALFDLAFDPEPYLSMTAAELAEAMAAVPRAIPTVKLNAMPALFSLDDTGAPAQTDEIDEETVRDRIERIEGRPDFLDRVSEALEIRNKYPESKHVEDQIYDGFPSWNDKKRMENFHKASSWATRYEIVKTLEDKRMRFFGARLILFNAPDVLPDQVRKAMLRGMINQRLMAEGDVPWTTCASARASLDAMEPSQDVARIRAWLDDYEQDLRLQLLSAAA